MTNIEALDSAMRLSAVFVASRAITRKKGVAPTTEQFITICNSSITVLNALIMKMAEDENISPWEIKERARIIIEEHKRLTS